MCLALGVFSFVIPHCVFDRDVHSLLSRVLCSILFLVLFCFTFHVSINMIYFLAPGFILWTVLQPFSPSCLKYFELPIVCMVFAYLNSDRPCQSDT